MKSTVFAFATLILAAISLSSCKKDPKLAELIIGNWQSTQIIAGDADLSNVNRFDLNFQSSREFDLDLRTTIAGVTQTISDSGDWQEDEGKWDITLTYNSNGEKITYDVQNIGNSEMDVEYTQNGTRYKIKFKKM